MKLALGRSATAAKVLPGVSAGCGGAALLAALLLLAALGAVGDSLPMPAAWSDGAMLPLHALAGLASLMLMLQLLLPLLLLLQCPSRYHSASTT